MRNLVMNRVRNLVLDHQQRAGLFKQPPRITIPADIESMSDAALLDFYERVFADSLPVEPQAREKL